MAGCGLCNNIASGEYRFAAIKGSAMIFLLFIILGISIILFLLSSIPTYSANMLSQIVLFQTPVLNRLH